MIKYATSNYYRTIKQTPWSKDQVEKLAVPQPVKKFLAIYQPTDLFTMDRHWSLS